MKYLAYIGTNNICGGQGIHRLAFDGQRAEWTGWVPASNSGYLVINREGTHIYSASEGMLFHGKASGGIVSYDCSTGGQRMLNRCFSGGQRPCSLSLRADGRELYAANFFGGSVAVIPLAEDGSLLEMRKLITETPLPGHLNGMHGVAPVGEKELGAVYLGTGSVILYDIETLEQTQRIDLDGETFPRQFVSSADGNRLYLLVQDPAEIHVAVRGADGRFAVKQVVSAVAEDFTGQGEAAAVKLSPDERLLFASSRGAHTIAVFHVDPDTGLLTGSSVEQLPVKTPRDFALTPDGKYLFAPGQVSDDVAIYEVDYENGALLLKLVLGGIVSPCCIAIKEG